MTHDFECPYCGAEDDYCDDPVGEGDPIEIECHKCEKNFIIRPSYSIDYSSEKAPCLNGGKHEWRPQCGAPKEFFEGKFECIICDKRKNENVQKN